VRRVKRLATAALQLAACTLALAGCGSGGGQTTSTGSSVQGAAGGASGPATPSGEGGSTAGATAQRLLGLPPVAEISLGRKPRIGFEDGHANAPGSSAGYLSHPDDAYQLPNGLISVADIVNCTATSWSRVSTRRGTSTC
jgi:hypothetical protein